VVREKRFRFGEKEREELAVDEKHLHDLGESNRFLPVLFCSPTMELGVDISALNAVYLRNVPPTPANYAQRSGRAGRSGQAALVLTYCAAQSPHDQYFFREPKAMVHGEVRPPLLDLANRDLVESHLHAVWLACTEEPLNPAISELLVLGDRDRPLRKELRSRMIEPRVATEATDRILRVLALVEGELTPEQAPWFPGREAYTTEIVRSAILRFDEAFDRWRDLFTAAEQQRDAARRTMDDYSAPQHEKKAAQGLHIQAQEQLNLLQKGSTGNSTDFYTYRYLATEGFLPGYNFPRLPLMAFVPSTQDGRGRQTYLQRPRFLALAEFGPRSLVYHEGRAYRVVKALLAVQRRDGATSDVKLQTKSVRICRGCGAAHFNDHASLCHGCGVDLGDAEIVRDTYRIENVGTWPAERITANDEERQRQGFELQTTFEWKGRDGGFDVDRGHASDADGAVAHLVYGPGATITRLNKGLRRRAHKSVLGFMIDPVSGYWAKNEDEDDDPKDPTSAPRQLIVPSVQDRKNALLFQPIGAELSQSTLATVQHALLRGLEATFQLEEGEVLAEPMPLRDSRSGFLFYEATEGGAGVLTRVVSESATLARVARKALEIMHFKADGVAGTSRDPHGLTDAEGTLCVAACYRCLMSYFNQPDHELLDRRDGPAREMLLRLARAATSVERGPSVHPGPVPSGVAPEVARWLELADKQGLPRPDAEALAVGEVRLPLVWRAHYVAVVRSGAEASARGPLEDCGFDVVAFEGPESAWGDAFARLATALGRAR
jgi:ribosomal protein L37E